MRYLTIVVFIFLFASCKKEGEVEFVYPEAYLPVYPGSFWDYTNGERSVVNPNYQVHWYEKSVNSTEVSTKKLVPLWDDKYVYGYSIYQNYPNYPMKKLLAEDKSSWIVHQINGENIKREVVSITDSVDISLLVNSIYIDTTFRNVITVVEYVDSLGVNRWNSKEYYAKGVGLVQAAANDPFSSTGAVVYKKLLRYHINK